MNIESTLAKEQGMKDIKKKSLQFYEKSSIVVFGLCVYFLLVLHSVIEIFEQSRFGRDTISLYKKVLSKKPNFKQAFKK